MIPELDAYPPEPENKPDSRTEEVMELFNGCHFLLLRILNNIYLTKDREAQLALVRSEFFVVMKNLMTPIAYIIMDAGHVPSFQIVNWLQSFPLRDKAGNVITNLDPLKHALADKAVELTLGIDNSTKVGDIFRKIQALLSAMVGH